MASIPRRSMNSSQISLVADASVRLSLPRVERTFKSVWVLQGWAGTGVGQT